MTNTYLVYAVQLQEDYDLDLFVKEAFSLSEMFVDRDQALALKEETINYFLTLFETKSKMDRTYVQSKDPFERYGGFDKKKVRQWMENNLKIGQDQSSEKASVEISYCMEWGTTRTTKSRKGYHRLGIYHKSEYLRGLKRIMGKYLQYLAMENEIKHTKEDLKSTPNHLKEEVYWRTRCDYTLNFVEIPKQVKGNYLALRLSHTDLSGISFAQLSNESIKSFFTFEDILTDTQQQAEDIMAESRETYFNLLRSLCEELGFDAIKGIIPAKDIDQLKDWTQGLVAFRVKGFANTPKRGISIRNQTELRKETTFLGHFYATKSLAKMVSVLNLFLKALPQQNREVELIMKR